MQQLTKPSISLKNHRDVRNNNNYYLVYTRAGICAMIFNHHHVDYAPLSTEWPDFCYTQFTKKRRGCSRSRYSRSMSVVVRARNVPPKTQGLPAVRMNLNEFALFELRGWYINLLITQVVFLTLKATISVFWFEIFIWITLSLFSWEKGDAQQKTDGISQMNI